MRARWVKGSLALGVIVAIGLVLLAATRVFGVPKEPRAPTDATSVAMRELPQGPLAAAAPAQAATKKVGSVATLAVPPGHVASPEGRLLAVYRAIAEQRMGEALRMAEALVRDQANFRLAQLVYADLLMMRSGQLDTFGGEDRQADPQSGTELAHMREEAMRRIAALRERPPLDKLPAQFVVMPEKVRHAIAVDVSRSRLYLFENGPQGVRLVTDYYVSIGKQGADKLVEGDQKTPLGVYFISEIADPKALEDRFGSGALALNYPNANDRAAGRTGSGIMLHGVPSDTYARAPRATDGCVALSNDDLQRLTRMIMPRDTPVVIAQQIEWVSPDQTRSGHGAFLEVLRHWQVDRLRDDDAAVAGYYTEVAAGDRVWLPPRSGDAAASRSPAPRGKSGTGVALAGFDDLTVLAWHEKRPLMVVAFRERLADGTRSRRLTRQYWALEGGQWKIFSQGTNV